MEGKKGGCGKKDVKVGSYQFRWLQSSIH